MRQDPTGATTSPASSVKSAAATAKRAPRPARPTPAQRRILVALASRPNAKIINGPYGVFVTDGRGWAPFDYHIMTAQLTALIDAGWVRYTQAPMGRAEYVVTAKGKEMVKVEVSA